MTLAFAIILSSLCATLGHLQSKHSLRAGMEIFIVSGLSLGALLAPLPINRYFLIGVLVYAAFSFFTSNRASVRKTISLVQLILIILLVLSSSLFDHPFFHFAGFFLVATLVPLPPFHLPFVSLVSSSQRTTSALWTTVFLSLGLAELSQVEALMSAGIHFAISLLALVSALYASFKCLGQTQIRPLLTYATIAQVSLLWGLTTVFSTFSQWGIPFGLTIALVMTGLIVSYQFVQERFGSHTIGTLPGLASPMPRLGTILIILISLAVVLPVIPVLTGLTTLPTMGNQDVSLIIISLIILSVWGFGSWYYSHLLHQTAFGKARSDISYTDLKTAEACALTLLIAGASYSGFFY